ncbi:hypothetical protein TrLO_g2697 [Triparma laevis f. longispina]|uniref:Fumarylacetoacetase-like C-terminal domain-containing protein n=1 Tax=Triparma laevis f. longispina TaxID=1714387 RepID=A0A9W6Z501_9STRA|nr:hypothetical protein TrLO_g2697 [Triparma laevis f. longispina]
MLSPRLPLLLRPPLILRSISTYIHAPVEPVCLSFYETAEDEEPKGVWPVNRVHLIGRNYAAHAAEMGDDPKKSSPFFFQKPSSAIVDTTKTSFATFPRSTSNYHYEAELILGIGKSSTSEIPLAHARNYISCIGVGCDLTRRDLQNEAKEKRRPWDDSKGIDDSGPISKMVGVGEDDAWWFNDDSILSLTVNGVKKQQTPVSKMIWNPEEIVHYISKRHNLNAGDVIFTGTPEGVGKLEKGEECKVRLEGGGKVLECCFELS